MLSLCRKAARKNISSLCRMMSTKREVADNELYCITGGGSGIGQATTLRLLARGITTVVFGPVEKELVATEALAKEQKLPGKMISVLGDIRAKEGRTAVADAIKATGKDLRVLIHNAGVNTPCKMMMDLGEEEWHRVMDINMNGPLFLTKELYPLFGETDTDKNRVLLLSTIAKNCTGLPNYGPYCVSKLGSYGVALMFKEELPTMAKPVYTSTLIPGEVDTEMQRATAYSDSSGFPDHLVKHWRMLQETKQLLPPAVPGAFIEFVTTDTNPKEFQDREWFVYDKDHHNRWADEFLDNNVKIQEPTGLFDGH